MGGDSDHEKPFRWQPRYSKICAVGGLFALTLLFQYWDLVRATIRGDPFTSSRGITWAATQGWPQRVHYSDYECPWPPDRRGCQDVFKNADVEGACAARADCNAACIFCRWGREDSASPCPDSVLGPSPEVRAACPARVPPANLPGRSAADASGCLSSMGLRPHPSQQLRGEILDVICQELRRAKARNAGATQSVDDVGANLLVFSLGHDSPMWLALNHAGLTRFVETSKEWVAMQQPNIQAVTLLAEYGHHYGEAYGIRCDPDRLGHFLRTMPPTLRRTCWDVILVDAPNGWAPGRMGAIYTAAQLAGPHTVVFVEDCERMVEGNYALWHLRKGRELRAISNGHGGITCMIYPAGE
mmetsp:Transcript_118589/g.342926  ORF Transcript_118589/g.342926 Transcript_118589/m.342926 type:complete len:357 (-) Transcript_118589:200-1270(-)